LSVLQAQKSKMRKYNLFVIASAQIPSDNRRQILYNKSKKLYGGDNDAT